MQVLLRNTHSGLFVLDHTTWTPIRTSARDFQTTLAAQRFVAAHSLPQVEIVFGFDHWPALPTGIRFATPPRLSASL